MLTASAIESVLLQSNYIVLCNTDNDCYWNVMGGEGIEKCMDEWVGCLGGNMKHRVKMSLEWYNGMISCGRIRGILKSKLIHVRYNLLCM